LPSGVPVGTVGIDNAKNAAALAIRILNLSS
jgi:phosphoribosylcarboxyaminoimidazole (NCAIR) mutase